ncbi:hypothetical protein C8J57DRAFT_1520443 [Mycena rebaudengoi]|nr:hypothetical protein C8J57DRAFT_1520443 [Mycena rebaudengoi]
MSLNVCTQSSVAPIALSYQLHSRTHVLECLRPVAIIALSHLRCSRTHVLEWLRPVALIVPSSCVLGLRSLNAQVLECSRPVIHPIALSSCVLGLMSLNVCIQSSATLIALSHPLRSRTHVLERLHPVISRVLGLASLSVGPAISCPLRSVIRGVLGLLSLNAISRLSHSVISRIFGLTSLNVRIQLSAALIALSHRPRSLIICCVLELLSLNVCIHHQPCSRPHVLEHWPSHLSSIVFIALSSCVLRLMSLNRGLSHLVLIALSSRVLRLMPLNVCGVTSLSVGQTISPPLRSVINGFLGLMS